MSEEAEIKDAVAGLLETRGDKYSSPSFFKTGGTRYLYESRWGPNKDREVVIKVDKEPKNPRAARHLARGCDTHNELGHVVAMNNPGVVKIIDYFDPREASKFGIRGWVTVEEKVHESKSLEEKVSEDGILSREDALSVATQLTRTMKSVVYEDKLYHRDLKPSNVVIDEKGKVKIVDWANACKTEEVISKFEPTVGGRESTSPRLMSSFTGEEAGYGEKDTVYAICSNLARVIRGRPIFNYDDIAGRATAWDTGESVLTDRKLDAAKHEKIIDKAIKDLPREYRVFKDVLRNGLTLYEGQRIQTLRGLEHSLQDSGKRMDWRKKAKRWGLIAAAAVAIGASTVGYGILEHTKGNLEKVRLESSQSTKLEQKRRLIDIHMMRRVKPEEGRYFNERYEDFVAGGAFSHWIYKFKDDQVAIAAFLNPDSTYTAIKNSGLDPNSKELKFEDFQENLKEIDFSTYREVYSTRFGASDMVTRQIRGDRDRKEGEKWKNAARRYEAEKKADQERLEKERSNSGIGFQPVSPILYKRDPNKAKKRGGYIEGLMNE